MPAQKIASQVHKRNGTFKKNPQRENKQEPKGLPWGNFGEVGEISPTGTLPCSLSSR